MLYLFHRPAFSDAGLIWKGNMDEINEKAKAIYNGEWIPVAQRLPEIGLRVLVIDDDEDQFIDIRMNDDLDEQWDTYTHWMPLPEPPLTI